MLNFRTLSLLLIVILLGCRNASNLVPEADINYLEKYHCWPYDVMVYTVDNIKVDSLFYTYPLQSYFGSNTKYQISTWIKYADFDSTVWSGMNKVLEQCDDNLELYNQIIKGEDIYFAGSYKYLKDKSGKEKRRYETILFLDVKANKLHSFKDINKVY
ncbi:hypothetical protein [Marinifilum fragile]|uniref:hypothetical protein n=1 Tax=Marinifilum fragile TaxID=570161 RepID=UPI002AAAA238|nr:hypothetical protein [Marinifilum fragile]